MNEQKTKDQILKSAFQYQAALVAFAYARLKDFGLAEDAVQDCFVFMVQHIDEFDAEDPSSNIFAWARSILRYKVLEASRKRAKWQLPVEDTELDDLIENVFIDSVGPEEAARYEEMIHALEGCMEKMGKESQSLMQGFYRETKSHAELATMKAQTVEAVKKALYRCRVFLRQCVARNLDDAKGGEFCR
jgi:RNA polymerase sigma factor (sigma-70 family)